MQKVKPKSITRVLTSVIVVLGVLSIAGQFSRFYLAHDYMLGIIPLFKADGEQTIPNWFSSMLLCNCALLLFMVAIERRNVSGGLFWYWIALSVIFLLMSAEEVAAFHEHIRFGFVPKITASFSWMLPGLIIVVILGAAFNGFLKALPKELRAAFLQAGVVYVTGALLFELLGGATLYISGHETLLYEVIATVEECLEMYGSVLFISALLGYLAELSVAIKVSADDGDQAITRQPFVQPQSVQAPERQLHSVQKF